jgi:peroxiredoxin
MSQLLNVDWSKLPVPEDDNGAVVRHLTNAKLPSLELPTTSGRNVNLAKLAGRSVVYAYPMTGEPNVPLPAGWDMIPGARGCTPQSCAFRDHAAELRKAGANHIFGVSTQSTEYQSELVERLHLPFPLLSDADLRFRKALELPTMCVEHKVLIQRLTLVIHNGQIEHVFYPVFPPDQNAINVVAWLRENPRCSD